MYQVGHAERPRDNNPKFDSLRAAMDEARTQINADIVIAVWCLFEPGATPLVVCLLYQDEVFVPTDPTRHGARS